MAFIRTILVALGLVLIVACIWAFGAGHFLSEFSQISALPWGKVSLIDLYLGFVIFAVIFFYMEKLPIALVLTLLMMTLGNWVPAFWLAYRLPKLVRLFRNQA